MTTSLKSKTIASFFRESTDENKMDAFVDLSKDINWHTFVHHPLIKNKFIERICAFVDALEEQEKTKPGQADSFKYMMRHADMSLDSVLAMCDKAYFIDMLRYVNPADWKWYQILHHSDGNDYIIVFRYQQNVEGEKELDFQRDIVNGDLDPKKILRIWRSDKSLVPWNAF